MELAVVEFLKQDRSPADLVAGLKKRPYRSAHRVEMISHPYGDGLNQLWQI
jgi:hypothetical protein